MRQAAKNQIPSIHKLDLEHAYFLMSTAKAMAELYEQKKEICSKYVHATSRGHEAIQLAVALQLMPQDFISPYYRDDAMLLGLGYSPYDLMLQLLAKQNDPFSGGRTYYAHPSSIREDMPKIPHQSSATGMQAIPCAGIAQGIQYLEAQQLSKKINPLPLAVCSLGDAAITEGEVAEAFQMAALKQLPILFLIQDNEWDISAHASEVRAMDAFYYAKGFKGLEAVQVNGSDFSECFLTVKKIIQKIRGFRSPFLLHAKVPLLNHHTSGVRKEWYRSAENLEAHQSRDPEPILAFQLLQAGLSKEELLQIRQKAKARVEADFEKALQAPEPKPEQLTQHIFAPTPIQEETGNRAPENGEKIIMVDAALHAVDEILKKHPEALLYGQDVGGELGGVFREAALLSKKYGDKRVFNTAIQEAYIIGSTVGMSAAGCKPIVEVQFADYIWPGLNQLFTELSRSCYLSNGKWPVQALIRVPIGAYGSGGPYHSSSIESVLMQIKGIKVVYPSNAADMKGLMKAAFYDPNPVVILEHKGLYWSKVPGTIESKTIEPDENYILPLGKGSLVLEAEKSIAESGLSMVIITYGMGVYWAKNAAQSFKGRISILDLRTLNPLDWELISNAVKQHGKAMVLTEETISYSFAEALAGKISSTLFEYLDAPIKIIGSVDVPAIPLNSILEKTMLPSSEKVALAIEDLLRY